MHASAITDAITAFMGQPDRTNCNLAYITDHQLPYTVNTLFSLSCEN